MLQQPLLERRFFTKEGEPTDDNQFNQARQIGHTVAA
jgi:hypothetical protein